MVLTPARAGLAAVLAVVARAVTGADADDPAGALTAILAPAVDDAVCGRLRALPHDTGEALYAWADALERAQLQAAAR